MTEHDARSAAPDELPPTLEIVRGDATEEELAALIAVIGDAYASEAAEAVAEEPRVSAWMRTQRDLRRPLRRDIPWGRFSG
ncbi:MULTISPECIES: acyl-CoA carboxylase subunit epsilon [unclassified Microbacterium]|uniref:acyl-CoA carboxylase subunit epsilon n=1 Tax=unclassified Microbacterium TaxID=2609290 RepID=UPI000EA94521|nr:MULTISPECIES: acyl-CoA carboxylase subunit epsilon [unclassified Microbacterium]MBT2486767.1 acyl-CoA carboxylase subunit epsilon [Microbacterium sp. ISL-108]RKN64696.1 acyl-CoA carboxylase subunit epsilon [Microbacterium sp. CGR2]